ncbi:MAG: hypothetical protein AAF580_15125, partial [Pseudomonadota bacterium]
MPQSLTRLILFAALASLPASAFAEVPIPRLSPGSSVTSASLVAADPSDETVREPADEPTLAEAIEREATVDVSLAVSAFYAERGFEPVWDPQKADALRARLADAGSDGFDPNDYFVPHASPGGLSDAAVDVSLTEAALRYAHHSMSGRVAPQSISRIMTIEPPKLDEARFLRRLARTKNVAATLDRLHPHHPQF